MPWSMDGRTLTDPTKSITEEERYALLGWLQKLRYALLGWLQKLSGDVQKKTSALAHDLFRCLDDYISDIRAHLPKNRPVPAVAFGVSDLNLSSGFSELLKNAALPFDGTAQNSPFTLKINPARTNKKIILISPEIARNFAVSAKMDTAQLSVWQGVYAADITSDILNSGARNKLGNIDMGAVEFRRPEDFFHDRIAIFSNVDTFCHDVEINGAGGIPWDFVLPIKRELLEFFSPEEIARRISFAKQGDNDIVMTFDFPLQGVGEIENFAFTKVYRQVSNKRSKDCCGISLNKEIPLIALWPNMRRADWHEYYFYYENHAAAGNIPADKMYYAEPWSKENLGAENFPNHGVKNLLIARLNALPEALVFNYYADGKAQEIGALLLKLPEEIPQDNNVWNVGIDFGTSSTMLYFQANGGAYQPLIFKPHLLKVSYEAARFYAVGYKFHGVNRAEGKRQRLFPQRIFFAREQQDDSAHSGRAHFEFYKSGGFHFAGHRRQDESQVERRPEYCQSLPRTDLPADSG